MKSFAKYLIAILPIFLIKAQNHFSITGILKGYSNHAKAYLIYNEATIDSAAIINGVFKVKGRIYERGPNNVMLNLTDQDDSQYLLFFIQKDSLVFRASKNKLQSSISIIRGKENWLNEHRRKLQYKLFETRNDLTKDYLNWSKLSKKEVAKKVDALNTIDKKLLEIDRKIIHTYIKSYYGINLLTYRLYDLPKKEVKILYQKIPKNLRDYEFAKQVKSFIEIEKIKIGDLYRDFIATDLFNKAHKFSTNFDGVQYVLLEFTSPFCYPCRIASPALEKMQLDFKDKLKVISFITDLNPNWKSEWLKFHSKNWTTLWDEKGITGPIPSNYSIFGTPQYHLFDPKGKLVYRANGFGEELLPEITKHLK